MPEWVLQVLSTFFLGGIAYGGIRSDLKAMHERTSAALSSAHRAHVRIDDHIDKHHTRD
jgi:outer membrane murein-binding lipoprotein Lpp